MDIRASTGTPIFVGIHNAGRSEMAASSSIERQKLTDELARGARGW